MTVTMVMERDTANAPAVEGFEYVEVDPSVIPARVMPLGRGRPAQPNPHTEAVTKIAGTGNTLAFTIPDPGTDEARTKVIARHTRLLRAAAHAQDRSVRIGHRLVERGDETLLQVAFRDQPRQRRPRKTTADTENDNVTAFDDVENDNAAAFDEL